MATDKLTVRIDTPSGSIPPGRGFYQIEEDVLFLAIGKQHSRSAFFSFLESESVHLDIDKTGLLRFVEIVRPRSTWEVANDLTLPTDGLFVDLRWLNFRDHFPEPKILTNERRNAVCVQFDEGTPATTVALATCIFLEIDERNTALRLWATKIIDDSAGRKLAHFLRSR